MPLVAGAAVPAMGLPFEAGVRRTTWPGGRVRLGLAWFVPTLTVRHDAGMGFVEAGAGPLPPLWGGDLFADATPVVDLRVGGRFGTAQSATEVGHLSER